MERQFATHQAVKLVKNGHHALISSAMTEGNRRLVHRSQLRLGDPNVMV